MRARLLGNRNEIVKLYIDKEGQREKTCVDNGQTLIREKSTKKNDGNITRRYPIQCCGISAESHNISLLSTQ